MKLRVLLIPRCRCFVFNGSSLPYLSQDFRGHAPHLRVLKLECMIDDGSSRPPPAPEIAAEGEFTFPVLSALTLGGSTFMDACNVPSWRRQLEALVIDTLSISNLTGPGADGNEDEDNDEDEPFGLYTFAKNLSDIGFVRHRIFDNVNTTWQRDYLEEGVYSMKLNNFTVVGKQDIEYVEELHLITFGPTLCYHHLADAALTWESMRRTPDMEKYDFQHAMTRFFGNRLDFLDCAKGLSERNSFHYCEPLRRLCIKGCSNITMEGLKKHDHRAESSC